MVDDLTIRFIRSIRVRFVEVENFCNFNWKFPSLCNEHESTESHESQGLFFQKSQATERISRI